MFSSQSPSTSSCPPELGKLCEGDRERWRGGEHSLRHVHHTGQQGQLKLSNGNILPPATSFPDTQALHHLLSRLGALLLFFSPYHFPTFIMQPLPVRSCGRHEASPQLLRAALSKPRSRSHSSHIAVRLHSAEQNSPFLWMVAALGLVHPSTQLALWLPGHAAGSHSTSRPEPNSQTVSHSMGL